MIGKGLNRVVQNIMYTDRGRLILSIILGIISCYIFLKLFNYFFKGPLILLVGSIFGLYIYIYGNNHRITTL